MKKIIPKPDVESTRKMIFIVLVMAFLILVLSFDVLVIVKQPNLEELGKIAPILFAPVVGLITVMVHRYFGKS